MDRSFQPRVERPIKPRETESDFIDRAYAKALEVVEYDKIDIADFVGSYDYDLHEVERDMREVDRLKDVFSRHDSSENEIVRKLAVILEAIIHEQTELSNWLGADVTTRKASDFDDYKNGIDTIAEFGHTDGRLVLAIDVTTTNPTKKLDGIKESINKGSLSGIKYFESGDGNFRARWGKGVPKVIVGVERRTVLQLAHLWLDKQKKDLETHPIQLQILDEIFVQLDVFMNYAYKIGNRRLASLYSKYKKIIASIRQSKSALYNKRGSQAYANDGPYNTLLDQLELQFDTRIPV